MLVRGLRGWWSGLRLWERSFEVRRKEVVKVGMDGVLGGGSF